MLARQMAIPSKLGAIKAAIRVMQRKQQARPDQHLLLRLLGGNPH
jgi:hypothetical protein